MDYLKLATTIQSIVRDAYVPFQGVEESTVIDKVQRFLSVSEYDIRCAIEIVLDWG